MIFIALGLLLIAVPFVVLLIEVVRLDGWREAVVSCGLTLGIVAAIAAGVILVTVGMVQL